jgi:superfamily II DNA or RNA helicase
METLDYLVARKLLDTEYRPVPPKEPIKIVQNGVIFQQKCRNGLPYDIAVSWLQKAIRRGLTQQAYYCAYHIANLGKIFRSHLLNRLITILSEDIGPAEPGLASVIERMYFDAKYCESNGLLDQMHDIIIKMVHLLSNSRKSRITDWLIHANEEKLESNMSENLDELISHALYLCHKQIHDKDWITVKMDASTDGKKKLSVYHIWNMLLTTTEGTDCHADILSLLKLFSSRGAAYGLLHLIHAITLTKLASVSPHDGGGTDLSTWSEIKELDFPVLNDAVDMHTSYGRRLLGRGDLEFLEHGAKLENWTPFPREKELIKKITEKHVPRDTDDSQPRTYQADIIHRSSIHLNENRSGWLLMACGTGKTKTSYWIMKDLMGGGATPKICVVVAPFLQILRQFHQCWSSMNRLHKMKSITGILASCDDSYSKDDYTNYEYLSTDDSIDRFLNYPDGLGLKFLFTTYHSLPKLVKSGLSPDLTIYDEAHHLNAQNMFSTGKELFLTATPPASFQIYGEVIAAYTLNNAINDGFLTPYKIGVFQETTEIDALKYVQQHAKKTIVYCKSNIVARSFRDEWSKAARGDKGEVFYVDCKTSKRERVRIFDAYRKAGKAIIFNCSILGEGVDFTECDSILIHSGYLSEKRVVQAMGRPLRLMEGKQLATINIMDDGRVERRINAMSRYDPEVRNKIEYLY